MAGTYSQQQLELKFNAISERLAAIESQLKVLSDKAEVSYEEPFAELPPEVLELAQAGNKMEAAKRYRELTGADGKEAMEAVGRI
jgi:ribosomal protein L7/L12